MSKQFEGTWEEASAIASEFIGHRVRVTLLEDKPKKGRRAAEAKSDLTPDPKATDTMRSIIPGRNHGKLYKEWPRATADTDISRTEFDSFDLAIAENRAMRREFAQDSND